MATNLIEISRANLLHNLEQFQKISSSAELWPVVKSNAYGHGLAEIASILSTAKAVAGFMVVSLEEAKFLRQFSQKPIIILSYFELVEADILWVIANHVSLPVYDLKTATWLNSIAGRAKQHIVINIKIDVGTGRLGVRAEEAVAFIKQIESLSFLKINSLYSHLAESESENLDFTNEQVNKFSLICQNFPNYKKHIACSAASIALAQSSFDIIRLGLSLYGLWPSRTTRNRASANNISLKPVLTWHSQIIQIKNIKAGESIGYNRTYQCLQDTRIAILPTGYFEGYSRLLSNQARVLINGLSCPVRGNICMNLMMVELPAGLVVKVGDRVTLLGAQGTEQITAEELASLSQTINYEFVTRLHPGISRKII